VLDLALDAACQSVMVQVSKLHAFVRHA
jgi:hypothetical protein